MCALYQDQLPRLSTSRAGAVGPPQLTDWLSLHAASHTPERFQAVPESQARTAAFALNSQARPARSLTGPFFDAAEFTIVTACSFASPRFNAQISPCAGGCLPGSSGGLPGWDLHPLVSRPFAGHTNSEPALKGHKPNGPLTVWESAGSSSSERSYFTSDHQTC